MITPTKTQPQQRVDLSCISRLEQKAPWFWDTRGLHALLLLPTCRRGLRIGDRSGAAGSSHVRIGDAHGDTKDYVAKQASGLGFNGE